VKGEHSRTARALLAAVAAGALVSALVPAFGTGPAAAAGTSSLVPPVGWHQCPAGSAAAMAGGFVCAAVAAPLDYRDPSGAKISLAVVEHVATGSHRRGVIFFNPGGPGGPGTVQLPQWIGLWPKELLREYDIVSWDPRGSGASTAVQCFPSAAAESAFLGKHALFPVGRVQQGAYINRWREFGRICAARNGALLRHVSTADSARDLNLLRQDLGQPKLDYLGVSYGTFLGATYANLFPRRVGRLVLDGNVPPEAWTNGGQTNPRLSTYLRMGSDEAAARALDAFLRICGQRSTQACAFSAGSPAATKAKWGALLARLRKAPIVLGGTAYTYAAVVTSASNALSYVQPYTTPVTGGSLPGWPQAAQGLQQLWMARNGKPAAMAAGGQRYGGVEQTFAVQCDEAPSPPASAYAGLQRLVLRRSGAIGLADLWSYDEPCATWPVRGQDTYTGPWNAHTSPILVIGNTTDPFIPLRDAVAMTRQLANARLLVVHGYGHTALLNPSTCASTYMTAYFRTGALPPKATVCRQNLPPFPPPAG
jgi:pimeloyl-ACP methyl ester carboxylesterase